MGLPDQEAAASHPLFNPPQAETDVSAMREGTNSLWDLMGRIIGRSGDLRSVVTGAAAEFSDLVTQDISGSGAYNDQLWRQNSMDIAFAAGVGDQWTQDVIDYKGDRARLVSEFETQIASHIPSGDEPMTMNQQLRKAEIVERFRARAQSRMDDLLEAGTKRKQMLQDGAEPAHVAQLVDSGALGWAAYNILGPGENPPLPVDSQEAKGMAADMGAYLDGKKPDARFFEIVSALTAITNKAVVLQGLDRANPAARLERNNLRSDEIGFLRRFYADLEDQTPRGVLFLPESMDTEYDVSDAETRVTLDQGQKEGWTAVADGLLILSDEGLGGSYDYLPDSIQRFADGEPYPNNAPGATGDSDEKANAWMREAEGLSRMLSRADPELRGGIEFSANVTTSTGHHLNAIGQQEHGWDDPLSSLLEVTTRNEQANHRILTDGHDHPTFDENVNSLEGLYTHEWEDGGAGVAGLTDWIPEAAGSDDEDRQEMAREAALGLIKMTTTKDMYSELTDTGIERDGITDASFGQLNPSIAASFGDVVRTYLGDFGLRENGEFAVKENAGKNGNEDILRIPYRNRQRFFEYIISDDRSAADLFSAVNGYDLLTVQQLSNGAEPQQAARENATLRALFDAGLRSEALDRTDDDLDKQKADQVTRDRWLGVLRTAGYAATGYAGVGFDGAWTTTRVAGAFFAAGTGFQEYDMRVNQQEATENYQPPKDLGIEKQGRFAQKHHPFAANEFGQTYTPSNLEYKTQIDLLNSMVKNGDICIDDVRKADPRLIVDDKEGNKSVITYYEHSDDRESSGVQEGVREALSSGEAPMEIPEEPSANGAKFVQFYTNTYHSRYSEVLTGLYPGITIKQYAEASQH